MNDRKQRYLDAGFSEEAVECVFTPLRILLDNFHNGNKEPFLLAVSTHDRMAEIQYAVNSENSKIRLGMSFEERMGLVSDEKSSSSN
jgi:hypothetical protein